MTTPTTRHPDDVRKWAFLAAAPHADVRHPQIRRKAEQLWEVADQNPERFVHLAHTLARDCIRYERDTARVGEEDVAGFTREPSPNDAVDALNRGVDDCDAKARLFVALCLAVRLRAKMEPLWNRAGRLQHVYASVMLDGKQQPVELTLRRARVGDDPYSVPFEKGTKKWLR